MCIHFDGLADSFLLLVDGWMLLLLLLANIYTIYLLLLHELPQKHTHTAHSGKLLCGEVDTDTYTRGNYSVDCLSQQKVLHSSHHRLCFAFWLVYLFIFLLFWFISTTMFGVKRKGTLFGYLIFGPRCGFLAMLKIDVICGTNFFFVYIIFFVVFVGAKNRWEIQGKKSLRGNSGREYPQFKIIFLNDGFFSKK